MSAPVRPMVRPPAKPSDGTVDGGFAYSSDDRIPSRLRRKDFDLWDSEAQEPRRVGHHLSAGYVDDKPVSRCPDGHLFDIIESTIEHELEDDDAQYGIRYEHDFRARLTCVGCGIVLAWEGRRTKDEHVATLAVEPLVAGDLVAQMVHSRVGSPDWSRYDVYRSTPSGLERVGSLWPTRGQRGRHFVQARLDGWAGGQVVEGKDPIGALRAIVRRERLEVAS